MHLDKISKLHDQVPPEELETVKAELEKKFRADKKTLEEEMEKEVLQSRNS
jgi:predicted unusual protein kinase regulating ubiquinone biosynthesis (AarF/ABC1/UbiB family)